MSVPIDSPSYYFVFDSCSNGEIYNLLVRGIVVGMTDAFDIWGDNIWVRDIEVTNGDECVTLKSPATNSLIENIYCNLSGGTAIGSIGTEANVSNVVYRNLYMNSADACYLKTNNGNGTIENIIWEDVIVHGGPYPLALNEAWDADPGSTGVKLRNLTFKVS
jgi:rhamnogalacturonan hydrolase